MHLEGAPAALDDYFRSQIAQQTYEAVSKGTAVPVPGYAREGRMRSALRAFRANLFDKHLRPKQYVELNLETHEAIATGTAVPLAESLQHNKNTRTAFNEYLSTLTPEDVNAYSRELNEIVAEFKTAHENADESLASAVLQKLADFISNRLTVIAAGVGTTALLSTLVDSWVAKGFMTVPGAFAMHTTIGVGYVFDKLAEQVREMQSPAAAKLYADSRNASHQMFYMAKMIEDFQNQHQNSDYEFPAGGVNDSLE